MAFTEIYVDPSIAGDSGTGTSGDPYGDLEYALEQTTRDSTNGDRFNIKSGTDEVLEFALDIVTDYGTPTEGAPLVFQGYTTSQGDGGIGGISGGGSVSIINATTLDFVHFVDLHLHNTGSAVILNLDQRCSVVRCEIDNSSNTGNVVEIGANSFIMSCHIHNIAGSVYAPNGALMFNYFENGTNKFVYTAFASGRTVVYRNIFHLSGSANSSNGILTGDASIVLNNSIWSDAGSGSGIMVGNNTVTALIANNLIEGFSATGGFGIEYSASNSGADFCGNNYIDDGCATDVDTPTRTIIDDLGTANEIASPSPFTSASTGDFSPVDTGGNKEGSLPDDFAGQ